MEKTFNEIEQIAEEKGILLDGVILDVRYYTFGVFVDLCDLDYRAQKFLMICLLINKY